MFLLLESIYNNRIYLQELYEILIQQQPNKNDYINFIKKIEKDYQEAKEKLNNIKEQIYRNKYKVSSAHNVRFSLSKNIPILKSYDVPNVIDIINYFELAGIISNKEAILLINEIELYNRRVKISKASLEEQNYTDSLYEEIPNIIWGGFQEHDEIEVHPNKKDTIDSFVKEIKHMIKYLEKEEIIDSIAIYQKYNLEINEYNYLIVKLLDEYLDEIMGLYQLILDKDIHTNKSRGERIETIKDYYNALEIYLILKEYYERVNEYIVDESEEEYQESVEEANQEERMLIYSHSNSNITKTRFISDMNNIAFEFYQEIYDLLSKFKDGTLSKKKMKRILNGNNKQGNLELKDDDIRIIIKRIKGNVYAIQGVFIKKDNNDMSMYRKVINRPLPEINNDSDLAKYLEISKVVHQEIEKLVQEKARKNGRK